MINHADIENVIGCKTLVTDRMQQAIEGWYDAAINGLPMNHNPETLTLGLPSLICSELARLTTLEQSEIRVRPVYSTTSFSFHILSRMSD